MQQLINGVTLGSVYALIALGYTMVYGILELINFAHGDIYMTGAYAGLLVLSFFNLQAFPGFLIIIPFLAVFIAAMPACGLLGMLIERVAYRPLRNAPRLAPLITAVGVSIILQNLVMLVAGSDNKAFPFIFPKGEVALFGAEITYIQAFICLFSLALMLALNLFIHKTKTGKAMRAVAIDRKMAGLVGIDVNRIISLTFFIGSGLAAAAGIMVGVYYGIINFTMGYMAGLKGFTAAVLGGIGNVRGAMAGGLLIGILESLGAGYISAQYKDVFAFGVLVIVLLVKPGGLFGESITANK